jgi:glutamine amidotransferase
MCRLFGMSAGSTPAKATFWLLQAPDSLATQSHREPDGTGLGWFDGEGHGHISKQPIAAYGDERFGREARKVSSRTFIAHVRFATTGALNRHNTHPFEQDGRMFAHNGVVEDLPLVEAHLGDDMRLVKGDTDSERFFALITRESAARGGDVDAGIEAACSWVAANLRLVSINFILATAEKLWALRYPEKDTLYLLERAPGEPLEHASSLGSRVHCDEGSERPLVVIASEPMDANPGWRALAAGELIQISSTLEVGSRRLFS